MRLSIGAHHVLASLVLMCGASIVPLEAAAQPSNDQSLHAVYIGVGSVTGTLVGASTDGSSTAETFPPQPDVWYRYTASGTGTLYVDTCGSNDAGGLDSVLSVHSGAPGTTSNELIANDDWPSGNDPTACQGVETVSPFRDSAVALAVTVGQALWIRVSQFDAFSAGDGTFQLHLVLDAPAADSWLNATAVDLGSLASTLAGATNDGSSSAGESEPDVWYTYTASRNGTLHVDTCGTHDVGGLDSILSLHSATPPDTTNELIANDDWDFGDDPTVCQGVETVPPFRDSAVALSVTAGQTLWIRISQLDEFSGGDGTFQLRLRFAKNDAWPDAFSVGLGTTSGTLAGTTSDGSSTYGHPGQPDVWYSYTAPDHRWLFIDTCGSNDSSGLDSVLSLHSAGPGTTANELIGNDDWPSSVTPAPGYCTPSPDSAVLYEFGAGETVLIRVSAFFYFAGEDDFVLTLPEPGTTASLVPALGMLGALYTRRRRLERAKAQLF